MKWDFEKLNNAEDARSKAVKDKWSEANLKQLQEKTRSEWYEKYNKEYQDGFEALLAEAGWTRHEYCDEYDRVIGYDIMAGHPSYFMRPFGRFIQGLKMLQSYEENCQVSIDSEKNSIVVRAPSYFPASTLLNRVCPSDMVEIKQYGFEWDLNAGGFVFWLGPKNVKAEETSP